MAIEKQNLNSNFADLITSTANGRVHRYDNALLRERLEGFKGHISDDAYQQIMNAYSAYSSPSWTPNMWQAIGERFGDYSAWTNFENQKMSNFNTAISEILNAQHKENYSDPLAELNRRKAAGLNDDISGGSSIGAGEAGDIALPENLPAPQNDGYSAVPEIASTVMQTVSLAMSMASSVQALNAGEIQLGLDSLDLFSKSNNTILESLGNALPESDIRILLDPYAKDIDGKRLFTDNEFMNASAKLHNALRMVTTDSRIPLSLRKKLRKSWRPGAGSIKANTELYSLLSDVYSKKKNAVSAAGDPFNRGGFEECLTLIGDHIQKTVYDVEKLTAKYQTDKLSVTNNNGDSLGTQAGKLEQNHIKYETDRLSVRGDNGESLGTLAGKSDASSYTAEAYQKEYDSIVNKMWDSIMYDLQHGKDKDAWWSKLLSFAIPVVRLWLGNIKMPSVSHTTTGKTGSTSFAF